MWPFILSNRGGGAGVLCCEISGITMADPGVVTENLILRLVSSFTGT